MEKQIVIFIRAENEEEKKIMISAKQKAVINTQSIKEYLLNLIKRDNE